MTMLKSKSVVLFYRFLGSQKEVLCLDMIQLCEMQVIEHVEED